MVNSCHTLIKKRFVSYCKKIPLAVSSVCSFRVEGNDEALIAGGVQHKSNGITPQCKTLVGSYLRYCLALVTWGKILRSLYTGSGH